ncbi:amidohydrolase 2 [Mycolicibacterium rhodesiae JS60]|nr:amidohydrolase 2 [Mycolicibacterium rhodesiae JS60]
MTRPRLPIIDGDAHVVEPFSLWDEELPAEFRPVARQRIVDETGKEVLYHHGTPLNLEWTVGSLATPGSGSIDGRLDHDLDTDVHPGVADPHQRLEVMDEQGLAVAVLFPSCTLGLDDVPDVDFRWAYARTYNSWIARFCAADPIRLRWGAVIPLVDVPRALDEVDRCLELGASTVMLSPVPRSGPGTVPFASPERDGLCHNLGHPDLDPLWEKLVAADVPAVVHAINPAANAYGIGWVYANRVQWQMGQPWQLQMAILHMIDGGTFDRFPRLRVGFFEGDVGWLPHWLGRMEETYDKFALVLKSHDRRPIETFVDQCWISGEPADLGLAHTVELVGAKRVLFASDWPHMDGAWPDPIVIVRDRADLSDQDKRDLLVHGAAEFFGIDMPKLMTHLGPDWSLDADVDDLAGMLPQNYKPSLGTAAVAGRR